MLLRANFIPDRLARRRRLERAARWGVRGLALACLFSLGLVMGLEALRQRGADQLRGVAGERAAVAAEAQRAAWLEDELARLGGPRELVRAVHLNNADWQALMTEVRDRMPEGDLWLTDLQVLPVTGPAGGEPLAHRVSLRGRSADHEAIAALLENLTRSPWFAEVRLQRTGQGAEASTASTASTVSEALEGLAEGAELDGMEGEEDGATPFVIEAALRRPLRPVSPARLDALPPEARS